MFLPTTSSALKSLLSGSTARTVFCIWMIHLIVHLSCFLSNRIYHYAFQLNSINLSRHYIGGYDSFCEQANLINGLMSVSFSSNVVASFISAQMAFVGFCAWTILTTVQRLFHSSWKTNASALYVGHTEKDKSLWTKPLIERTVSKAGSWTSHPQADDINTSSSDDEYPSIQISPE